MSGSEGRGLNAYLRTPRQVASPLSVRARRPATQVVPGSCAPGDDTEGWTTRHRSTGGCRARAGRGPGPPAGLQLGPPSAPSQPAPPRSRERRTLGPAREADPALCVLVARAPPPRGPPSASQRFGDRDEQLPQELLVAREHHVIDRIDQAGEQRHLVSDICQDLEVDRRHGPCEHLGVLGRQRGFGCPRAAPDSVPSWWRPARPSHVLRLDRFQRGVRGRPVEGTEQTEGVEARDCSAQCTPQRTGQEPRCLGAPSEVYVSNDKAEPVPMARSPGETTVQASHLDRARLAGGMCQPGKERRGSVPTARHGAPRSHGRRGPRTRFGAHRATRPNNDRCLPGNHAYLQFL